MKKLFVLFILLALIASCKKEETAPVPGEKTYTVEYKVTATPKANTTISGEISYVSKTSASSTATFSTSPWTVTESAWKLKAGDQIGFTATLSNVSSYEAFVIVDGVVRVFERTFSTFMPSPTTVVLQYKVE